MENHLIIGLGGSGGKVVKALRKRVYEEFGNKEQIFQDGQVAMSYLWVDSSSADMNETSSWKTNGMNVRLLPNDLVRITGTNGIVLDHLSNLAGISPWMGNKVVWQDVQKGVVGEVIGGQRRRLGRYLLAYNIKQFKSALVNHVQGLTSLGSNNVTFHIVAGLAGGTGGGSIIDVVTQIRNQFKPSESAKYQILLYLQLPQRLPKAGYDQGYYHANGYAALKELNALSTGAYLPYDVSAECLNVDGEVERLLGGVLAFDGAYLFSDENQYGMTQDVEVQLPRAVSDFIFQKTLAKWRVPNGNLDRVETAENNFPVPEMIVGTDVPQRSKRFMTFGVKRIEYPEEEIKEFIAYAFARQTTLQFLFNSWKDDVGYVERTEDEIGIGIESELKAPAAAEKLLLTDEDLMLSSRVVPPDSNYAKNWQNIKDLWLALIERFGEDAKKGEKQHWLTELQKLCKAQYEENFRGEGVIGFYKNHEKSVSGYAQTICRHIETLLLNEWANGQRSLAGVAKYLAVLIDVCNERLNGYDTEVATLNANLENNIVPQMKKNLRKWGAIGALADAFGKSKQVFDDHKSSLREYYTSKTLVEGYRFAKLLLNKVIHELSDVLLAVNEFRAVVAEVKADIDQKLAMLCNDPGIIDNAGMIVKMYKPDKVRHIVQNFVCDRSLQETNTLNIRQRLIGEIIDPDFKKMAQQGAEVLIDSLESICIVKASDKMIDSQISGVNILRKIEEEYGKEEKLNGFIKSVIDHSGNFLQFNSLEMQNGSNLMKGLVLVLPAYDKDYRNIFIQNFAASIPQGLSFSVVTDVVENYKPNQIIVFSVASAFPLRYVDNLRFLREKYEAMFIGPDKEKNLLLLHTEGDGSQFPSLYPLTPLEKRQADIPNLLLAYVIGLIQREEDPETGLTELVIKTYNENGLPKYTCWLGEDVVKAVDKIAAAEEVRYFLECWVEENLKENYKHVQKKEMLKQKVVEVVKGEVFEICGKNQKNPDFIDFNRAANRIIEEKLSVKSKE